LCKLWPEALSLEKSIVIYEVTNISEETLDFIKKDSANRIADKKQTESV
jgi:hypothetical protein